MCLSYVYRTVNIPEDKPIVAYKYFEINLVTGELSFPYYPKSNFRLPLNVQIEDKNPQSKNLKSLNRETYPSGFHAYKRKTDATKEFDISKDNIRIFKVLLSGTITIGNQWNYNAYCASHMKIIPNRRYTKKFLGEKKDVFGHN